MRELLKRSRHWLMVGWFWPLVLLALPNCILNAGPYEGEKHVFEPGNQLKSSAIMCGIPKAEFVQNVVCATDADEEEGIPIPSRYRAQKWRQQHHRPGLLAGGGGAVRRPAAQDRVLRHVP